MRVITLDKGSMTLTNFLSAGFQDVRAETDKTADFRHKTADELFRDGLITRLAHVTLEDGQRRSFELPNPGAVGLFISHLAVCSTEHTTLVLEDDAVPQPQLPAQLEAALKLSQQYKDALDIVIFGPVKTFQDMTPWVPPHITPKPTGGFEPLGNRGFFGTHGVLYTAAGCGLLRDALSPPFDMQIDGALSLHAQAALTNGHPANTTLDVWLETGGPSIVQDQSYVARMRSHLNSEGCCYCNGPANACRRLAEPPPRDNARHDPLALPALSRLALRGKKGVEIVQREVLMPAAVVEQLPASVREG